MKIDFAAVRQCLKAFDFGTLFREHLGWDRHQARLDIPVESGVISLQAIAQKRGFVAFVCDSIPDRATRMKIDRLVTKSNREHFIIYASEPTGVQIWQWVRREAARPSSSHDHRFEVAGNGDALIQRLEKIAITLEEEESLTVVEVVGRTKAAFDVEKVTKKFYERFKTEHAAFHKLIRGIEGEGDREWYTSLMLNRLMFVYFIQKKGFLDSDPDYLRNRLTRVKALKGKDKFHSFYRYFLVRMFHDGLGKPKGERRLDRELEQLLGQVPYLNGGFFEVHALEERNTEIDIPDQAFVRLFDFFDEFSWHLDERPLRTGNEINPDVVGYIFEKYINQKQMGAYYTKEDITEYISKNTIIAFLFDAAQKKCAVAFRPDSFLWGLLRSDPDRYIYAAVRQGVIDEKGQVIPLPKEIAAGIDDVTRRDGWNRPASEPFGLPTETWREHVARRQRCLELRSKLAAGEVVAINDLITLNLDIWQFARDTIVNCEGPELLRAFWQAIAGRTAPKGNEKFEPGITVLDPTCGSGAFLFAALRILETLYADCLERMTMFLDDAAGSKAHPEKYADFRQTLEQIGKHPNERYFILKSIIINNLFGVDIMEEAVEICKLRLFLKLVAQVERVDQIEPLPDIDFNIRSGNTLVGYVSIDEIRKARSTERRGNVTQKRLLDNTDDAEISRLEEDALAVERCFSQFRAQQTTYGGRVTPKDKAELNKRLGTLSSELDSSLAQQYGVDTKARSKVALWKTTHQPFHWFIEFYGIMQHGGFDIIIGNPPYIEYSKVRSHYTVRDYSTESCGNLYAFVWERCFNLRKRHGRCGMIQPVAAVCTEGYSPLQKLLGSSPESVGKKWG